MKRSYTGDPQENPSRPSRHERVQWDEANLEQNDKIKDELRPRKCDEPKTPYHGPMDTDEELSLEEPGMSPLALDDEEEVTQSQPVSSRQPNGGVILQDVADALQLSDGAHSLDRSREHSGDSTGTGSSGEDGKRKNSKFREHRRAHYKMREALRRGKQLASDDLGDEADSSQGNTEKNRHLETTGKG